MPARFTTSIVWLRRDLRLADNVALARATQASERVVCAFVLDPGLLRGPTVGAPIVSFFFDALTELRSALRSHGSDLALLEGDFAAELQRLASSVGATALYYNLDYEPSARERDARVSRAFERAGAHVEACLDHVYFGADETRKADGPPYTVFTPFKRRWLERQRDDARRPVDSLAAVARKAAKRAEIGETLAVPEPSAYGHEGSPAFPTGGEAKAQAVLDAFVRGPIGSYAEARNFPAVAGTALLSPHLRAGTIGIRTCVHAALEARRGARGATATGCETWLGELIWRDFYQQILANFPRVATGPFDERAESLRYRESESDWQAWCDGRTGYPIVDAAMRQLNTYGWMHNRLRMIVASFLTKDLLLDYRLGERYFERHLADGDKAANNGGWQWSASTGTDAAPYFRVFNPILQSRKFDSDGAFIKTHVPELAKVSAAAVHAPWTLSPLEAAASGFRLGVDYPAPIVDHAEARLRALAFYAPVLGKPVTLPEAGRELDARHRARAFGQKPLRVAAGRGGGPSGHFGRDGPPHAARCGMGSPPGTASPFAPGELDGRGNGGRPGLRAHGALTRAASGGTLLVDSLGTWLDDRLSSAHPELFDEPARLEAALEADCAALVAALARSAATAIVVGEETGWGIVPAHASARVFRDVLGRLQQRLAANATHAYLVVSGFALDLRAAGTPIAMNDPSDLPGESHAEAAPAEKPDWVAWARAIVPGDPAARERARTRVDALTKPLGALGRLEELAVQLSGIAGHEPDHAYTASAILVAAGDHGVSAENVSAYPAAVTPQMVAAFTGGYAAINALARTAGADLFVADFGIAEPPAPHPALFEVRVGAGTANLAREPALTEAQVDAALNAGISVFERLFARRRYDVLALGEMGIGNSTSAAAIVAAFTGAQPSEVVGYGTGIDAAGFARKVATVERALARFGARDWGTVAREVGGFEIVGLAGVMLAAARRRVPVVLDGFIVAAAALVACAIAPATADYCIAAHVSTERGHRAALAALSLRPLLDLDLRLGEATGAALALPLVEAATRMICEMKTFAEAGVATAS